MEATAIPGLQFYAYDMQLGEAFLVVGHTLSTIYSTTMDVVNYHDKVILFTGDRNATRECVPVVLPPLAAFAWKQESHNWKKARSMAPKTLAANSLSTLKHTS